MNFRIFNLRYYSLVNRAEMSNACAEPHLIIVHTGVVTHDTDGSQFLESRVFRGFHLFAANIPKKQKTQMFIRLINNKLFITYNTKVLFFQKNDLVIAY